MERTGLSKIWGFLILLLLGIVTANGLQVKAAEFSFSGSYYYLYLGEDGKESRALKVEGVPEGAEITFATSNEKVATVDPNGVVTAVAPGNASITCTAVTGEQETVCKTSIKVRDAVTEITLSLESTTQRSNNLRKNKEYPLTYTCKTKAGTNKTYGNYLYYEVLNKKGEPAQNAAVTDGVFKATRCATYTVKVYCFLNESTFKTWNTDREKYAGKLMASDELVLTVTLANFSTREERVSDWTMQIPEDYFVGEQDFADGTLTCSVNALNGKELASSNIHIRVDSLVKEPDFEALKNAMSQAYTKEMLSESWQTAYSAKKCTVQNLKKQTITLGGKKVYKIGYDITLKNIHFVFEEGVDISIPSLAFHNTIYTWYDGMEHITVNVIDAYEALQPNMTDAAQKLVSTFRRLDSTEEVVETVE
ncbi:MAG: Ig-like domain-containing protein [Lachnospiraceae bacterium]|nr:Ig-like domain-containing protein [Lachnospiraceae bacterium]